MKKLIAGLFAAVLMSAGLVAFSGSPASAVCGDQYTGPCPPTQAQVNPGKADNKPVKRGTKPKVKFKAAAADGTVPSGRVVIVVKLPGGGTKKVTYKYDGGTDRLALPKLNKVGKYQVVVKFIPKGKYKADKSSFEIKVRR